MRFRDKLFRNINRVFSRDPLPFLALRLRYSSAMTWRVSDGHLYTSVTGGPGVSLSIDLSGYTVTALVSYLAAQPGYSVLYIDGTSLASLSALVLIDGHGDQDASNGDHLYGYTAPNWAYLEALSAELESAKGIIPLIPAEMATNTADGPWLDLLGSYYKVVRQSGETDGSYGVRIIQTVIQPKCNNVAIEMAIQAVTGQVTTVTDVATYGTPATTHNGTHLRNGSINHSSAAIAATFGLFDVTVGYDSLSGGDTTAFTLLVKSLVETLRAGGTHLRAVALNATGILDTLGSAPAEGGDSLTINHLHFRDGTYGRNGAILHTLLDATASTLTG